MSTMSEARAPVLLGALLGWRRYPMPRGSVVRIQVSKASRQAREGDFDEFDIGMNTIQLRALGEDLIRAADERDGRQAGEARRRGWWRF